MEGIGELRALANPTRLRMLDLLAHTPMSAAEVSRRLGIAHASASFHLRQLAAVGKLPTALNWIADFLTSGEPLVVFAEHIAIQNALLERFPSAVHILGSDSGEAREGYRELVGYTPRLITSRAARRLAPILLSPRISDLFSAAREPELTEIIPDLLRSIPAFAGTAGPSARDLAKRSAPSVGP